MKTKRKALNLLLVMALLMGLTQTAIFAAQVHEFEIQGMKFTDMPDDWSKEALVNAVKNGLLTGYAGKIMAKEYLTRAQMAAIINRAFGASEEALLTQYTDVSKNAWYCSDMAKAVHMGTFIGTGNKLNPESFITREEVFTVLARAFKLTVSSKDILDKFSDMDQVSSWAIQSASSLVLAGYVQGSYGKISPKEYITRAEFAQLMDNLIKKYIQVPDTVSEDIAGNLMVNVPSVTIRDMTITGDLILGDGVGDGDVNLINVIVKGRMVIRGGGANSIRISGNSYIGSIIIARVNGVVRVITEDGVEIGEIICDGKDNVILEGSIASVTIDSPDITLTASHANIDRVVINGAKSKVILSDNTTIQTIEIYGENSQVLVPAGTSVHHIGVNSAGADISGEGKIDKVEANANNVTVTTQGTQVTAYEGATGVIAGTTPVGGGETILVPGGTSGNQKHSIPDSHRLIVYSNPNGTGNVNGIGSYTEGTQILLIAEAVEGNGYKFVNWTQGGIVVSTSETFIYTMPYSDTSLVANFIPEGSIAVASAKDLHDMRYNLSADYVQVAHINLDVSPYNEGTGWVPVGDYDHKFTGSFDGNSYKIQNLQLTDTTMDNIGLFGVMGNAELINVTLRDVGISAHYNVGGLVGTMLDGSITGCSTEGVITGEYMVGGLVGLNAGGNIVNCETSGEVAGGYLTGGLAGACGSTGRVTGCSSDADVSGNDVIGGLVGKNLGLVDECFSEGTVTTLEPDMEDPALQAGKMSALFDLFITIAAYPDARNTLVDTYKELLGPTGEITSLEVQMERFFGLEAVYDAIARNPEITEYLVGLAKELMGEPTTMESPLLQSVRVSSLSRLYMLMGEYPEQAVNLKQAALELAGEPGDMSSAEVQAARVLSFRELYDAMARQSEIAEELMATALVLAGEPGDLSSPEVQAARAMSFSSLYDAMARQPEMAEELVDAALELAGEPGDMSSPEVQAARVLSLSALYVAMARQPEMAEELVDAALELVGGHGDLSSPKVQTARARSFSSLYESIARQPEMAEELVDAALALTGEPGDLSSPEVQAARVLSFSSLYQAMARQPEMLDELVSAALELTGGPGDLTSAEVQRSRIMSFSILYEAIARQPVIVEELVDAALELTGEAADMSSAELQALRVMSFRSLYTSMARQPEMAEELVDAALKLTGEAGDLSSPQVQSSRVMSFSSLYEAMARQPEIAEEMVEVARELSGDAGDMSSQFVQATRLQSFAQLFYAVAEYPEIAETIVQSAIVLTGETGDVSSNEAQMSKMYALNALYLAMQNRPDAAETLIEIANELTGSLEEFSCPEAQALRMRAIHALYSEMETGTTNLVRDAIMEFSGDKSDWTSPEIQAERAYSLQYLLYSLNRHPEKAEIMKEATFALIGEKEDLLKVKTGGLVGVNAGTISSSYASGDVSGWWYAGGLTGSNSGTITGSYAVNNRIGASAEYMEGMSFGRITGMSTGTLTDNYTNKNMEEPFAGAFQGKDKIHTGKDGGNLSSWDIDNDGNIIAIQEEYLLTVNPPFVNTSENFDAVFTLTLANDTVTNAVYASDIVLGGCFSALELSSVAMTDNTTVTAQVYGSLIQTGIGTITLNNNVLLFSPEPLTAAVEVVQSSSGALGEGFIFADRQEIIGACQWVCIPDEHLWSLPQAKQDIDRKIIFPSTYLGTRGRGSKNPTLL